MNTAHTAKADIIENTEYSLEDLEIIEEVSNNFLFEDNNERIVKFYQYTYWDKIFSFLNSGREKPSKRAENEIYGAKILENTRLGSPETERIDEKITRKEKIDGLTLDEAAGQYEGEDAIELGRELGRGFREMEEESIYEPDLGFRDIIVQEEQEGYKLIILDLENLQEGAPSSKIRERSKYLGRSLHIYDNYEDLKQGFEEEYVNLN